MNFIIIITANLLVAFVVAVSSASCDILLLLLFILKFVLFMKGEHIW